MIRKFQKPGRSLVLSNNGMVASSHSLSSSIGVETLKKGGNAVDAAMAMAFVLPLCEPQSTGYFGDLFCIISQPNDEKARADSSSQLVPSIRITPTRESCGLDIT